MEPAAPRPAMTVEIWSDVVCPWCYIGKRRFEAALEQFEHAGEVEVVWRSFELDPMAPARREGSQAEHLARKYGMSVEQARAAQERLTLAAEREGLFYDFDRTQPGNTLDAHRLVHLAAAHGRQDEMEEHLFEAYFSKGRPISDHATLVELGAEVGLDADEVAGALAGDAWTDAVRADQREAQRLGISAVPFFVIDRAYGVSGAQNPDVLLDALETAWAASHPLTMMGGRDTAAGAGDPGEACDDGSCAI